MSQNHSTKEPSFLSAILPILFLVGLLGLNVWIFGDNALGGANQLALVFSTAVATIIGTRHGFSWGKIQDGIIASIKSALPALLILLLIGALAGTWMISGIVPTMIYYGLKILNPTFFLVAACMVSAIVSVATGSSWSTIATVGVALLGIGTALGIGQGMVAGAIISGAYFGDKMSPLSDTTNLAPAMAGTNLFIHIKYMSITTVPTLIVTLLLFLIIGFTMEIKTSAVGVDQMLAALSDTFYISPVLFVVPVVVIALIVKKINAIPALFIGAFLGGIAAVIFQPNIVQSIAGGKGSYFEQAYIALIQSMSSTTTILTENEQVNGLLSTKGMFGMMNTIWLIISAMTFGGVMEACGLLQKITSTIIRFATSTSSLVATTAGTCIFFNATASDQYLAIVVPGKMFAKTYKDRGLKPENLSRTLEDSGTVTSVLFPWNTCGATQASVLGVATGTYWMYCFFNLLSPLMTFIFAYFNIKISRYSAEEMNAHKLETNEG